MTVAILERERYTEDDSIRGRAKHNDSEYLMAREGDTPRTKLTRRQAPAYGKYPVTGAVYFLQGERVRPIPDWLARRNARRARAISTADNLRNISELFHPTAEGEHTATDAALKLVTLVIVAVLAGMAKIHLLR